MLVIDDHRSFAEALAIAIDVEDDLACVAIAGTAAAGLVAAERVRPDRVVVDLQLPDMPGAELVPRLRAVLPGVPILALTAYADAASVAAAARSGVCAFLRKECSLREIVASLRSAEDGPMAIDAVTLGAMMRTAPQPAVTRSAVSVAGVRLTPRESEVLSLLDQGCDAQAIARRLAISIHTTRGYVKTLLAKLDAHTQLEAVANARRSGLLGGRPEPDVIELPELLATSTSAG